MTGPIVAAIRQPPPPSLVSSIPEFVVAGILALFGLRSLRTWTRRRFESDAPGDLVLYAGHVTARVGMWFVLAGLFVALAFADDAQSVTWLLFVAIILAAVQLLSAFFLGRPAMRLPGSGPPPDGNGRGMTTADRTPGPLEPEKHGETSDPGHPQPEAAKVESARVLANQAREALRGAGLEDREIRRLADEYIALDRGEGLAEFVEWAKARASP